MKPLSPDQVTLIFAEDYTTERRRVPGFLRVQRYSTQKIATRYRGKAAMNTGLFPPVLRWLSKDMLSCVIERPPMMMTIEMKFARKLRAGETIKYTVPLPWLLYYMRIESSGRPYGYKIADTGVFARNSSLMSDEDDCYVLALPNLRIDGSMCVPEPNDNPMDEFGTLASKANYIMNLFWTAGSNMNVTNAFEERGPDYICEKAGVKPATLDDAEYLMRYFEAWSQMTIEEMLEVQFKHKRTFGEILKEKNTEPALRLGAKDSLSQFLLVGIDHAKVKDIPYENKTTGRPPF